jgi:ribulose 1,5-bisphosphate synthetase/thiazole synthase
MHHSSWLSVIALTGLILWGCSPESSRGNNRYDVVVYGGTSAGVIAAYTAWKQGYDVVLIEAGNHLGGLTSGGLGQTDIGNKYAVQGLARKFYRDLGYH